MHKRLLACVMVAGLVAAGCTGKGAVKANPGTAAAGATTTTIDTDKKFGSLDNPCGKSDKTATVKATQNGGKTDKLYIGVANDREGIRPGLLKELWDGTNAFVKWCNDHGGINGLQLAAVDLDGQVVQVEAATAKGCTSVFAFVGGGYAQDDGMFSGKPGSDFHQCKLIAVPGFAVSTAFAEGSDQVQPIPNPAYDKAGNSLDALAKLYPDDVSKFGVVYGNLPSIIQNKDQIIGVAKKIKGYGTYAEVSYDIINQDWGVIAQQVMTKGLKDVSFVGEPPNMSKFSQALKDQGYTGIINADANQYDSRLIEASGPAAVEGDIVHIPTYMFEEASKWPAMDQLVKIFNTEVPDWQHAGLSIYAFSAGLMFAGAAKSCADVGEITRECVLKAVQGVHKWDGGGIQTQTDPGANTPAACGVLVQIKNGKFERLFPKLDSKDDNGKGFYCSPTIKLSGDYGKGNTISSILG